MPSVVDGFYIGGMRLEVDRDVNRTGCPKDRLGGTILVGLPNSRAVSSLKDSFQNADILSGF